MIEAMELQRRHIFSALLVLLSAFIFPFARARWSTLTLELFDHNLYFVWGRFSLRYNSVQLYGSPFPNPFDTRAIVVFWIGSSIILALSILYLANSKHQTTRGLPTTAVLFALQIIVLAFQSILPLFVFGSDPGPFIHSYGAASYPIPSVLSIIMFSALFLMQRRDELSGPYHRASLGVVSSGSRVLIQENEHHYV